MPSLYQTIVNSSTLESLRNRFELWSWNTLPKASNSSKIRAQGMQNTSQKNSFIEQQQDSCPRYAKHKPEKLFHVTFGIQKKFFWAARAHAQPRNPSSSPPKHAAKLSRNLALEHRFRKPRTAKHKRYSLRCEKSQTPSGHEPKTAKTRSKKLFHVTFGIHKNNVLGLAKSGLGTPLPKASNSKTQARKPRTAKHKR